MFTGLVADLGTVAAVDATADGVRLTAATALARDRRGRLGRGQRRLPDGRRRSPATRFGADVMHETLRRSSLGGAGARARAVNLELALRAADRLGGHIVQGHVDGVGAVVGGARGRLRARRHDRRPRTRRSCATSSRRARSRSTASR